MRPQTAIKANGADLSALWFPSLSLPSSRDIKPTILVHGFAPKKTENGLFVSAAPYLPSLGILLISYDWRGRGTGDFANTQFDSCACPFGLTKQLMSTVARHEGATPSYSAGGGARGGRG